MKQAIRNAKVYQQHTGEFLPQTILVDGERISGILAPDESLPECLHIDGTNMFLTPGLIDTFSQIGLKETGIRWEGNDGYEPLAESGSHLQVIDGVYPFDKAFKDAVAFGVTTAHIASSPESVIGAKTAVLHTHGITVDEMALNPEFGFSFSLGDIPKRAFFEQTKTPLTRMGIAQKVRLALQVLQHSGNHQKRPFFFRTHRADDIVTAVRIAEETKIPLVLVHATEFRFIKNIPYDKAFSVIAGPCFQPMERGELVHLDPSLYRTLAEQNIPFTFATDHPVSSITHLQMEACLALKAGVDEQLILNGLTRDAAKLLQIDHLTGSIEEGLYADLVLWNKHPLELTARPVQTFIKGKEVYREE